MDNASQQHPSRAMLHSARGPPQGRTAVGSRLTALAARRRLPEAAVGVGMRPVFAAFAATVLLMGGCAPGTRSPAMPSMALAPSPTSVLGRELESVVREHPGQSGFHLINDGREAFVTRTVLAGLAERTIDAQYYLWDVDATGTLLLHHLMR